MRRPANPRNSDRPTFPIANEWGIPQLAADRLAPAEILTAPLYLYRTKPLTRTHAEQRLVSFFIDDYRFQCCWTYPERLLSQLLASRPAAVMEPNFTLAPQQPRAEQLHAVYRSRWCAALWQSAGLPIVPVLNWTDSASFAWCFAGIPHRPPVVALQIRTARKTDRSMLGDGLQAANSLVQPQTLLIYGTPRDWVDIPTGLPVTWLQPPTNARFEALRAHREATRHDRFKK